MKRLMMVAAAAAALLPGLVHADEGESLVCKWNIDYCRRNGENYGKASAPSWQDDIEVKAGCHGNVAIEWKGIYGEVCSFSGTAAAGEGGLTYVDSMGTNPSGRATLQCTNGQFVLKESKSDCRTSSSAANSKSKNEPPKPLVKAYFSPAEVEAGELFTFNWYALDGQVENVLFDCDSKDGNQRMVMQGGSGMYGQLPRRIDHVGDTLFCRVIPYGPLTEYQRNVIWVNSQGVKQVQPLGDAAAYQTIRLKTKAPSEPIITGSVDNRDGTYMVTISDGRIERRIRRDENGNIIRSDGSLLSPQDMMPSVTFHGKAYGVPAR